MSEIFSMKKITSSLYLCLILKVGLCQTPFICDGQPIIVSSQDYEFSTVYQVAVDADGGNVGFNEIVALPDLHASAIGYRVTDNLIYGIDRSSMNVFRFDALGNVEFLCPITATTGYYFGAGDVTPDGRYLVALGNHFSSNDRILLYVNLVSGNYEQTAIPITTASGIYIFSGDIAFHPLTGELFGFDAAHHRLLTFNPDIPLIDDETFPVQYEVNHLPSLFFEPFGKLYGLGNHIITYPFAFFEVNHLTGDGYAIAPAIELTGSTDGCSCPYILALEQSISPEEAFPCTEVIVTFRVANLTGISQHGVSLEQEFQNQTIINEVLYNPYGGNIGTSIGTNQLRLSNLTIPIGIDSIMIKIDIGELPPGTYNHQARLLEAELINYGDTMVLSDDPNTLMRLDSTPLEVIPLVLDLDNNQDYFCYGESALIEASVGNGVSYLWNNGATTSHLQVNTPGLYSVTISTGCEILSDSIFLYQGGLLLDLGEDQTVELGDQIILDPFVSTFGSMLDYRWYEADTLPVDCGFCKELSVTPLNDISYTLHISDEYGCMATDTIKLFVEKNYDLYLPNAFSPNDDGINDYFFPQAKHDVSVKSLQIFDRWGNHIFSSQNINSNDMQAGWDGSFRNKKVGKGIYVWTLEVEFLDGEVRHLSGDVLLLR